MNVDVLLVHLRLLHLSLLTESQVVEGEDYFQNETWLQQRALSAVLCLTCQRVCSSDRAAARRGVGGD